MGISTGIVIINDLYRYEINGTNLSHHNHPTT